MSTALSALSSTQQEELLLQQASEMWANFRWTDRLPEMEETLSSTKEAREQSLAARKILAETTKQFKKAVKTLETQASSSNTEAALTTAVESLGKQSRNTVKAYQEEIDQLTRRCKAAETCYSNLCQELFVLVDPFQLLQQQAAVAEQAAQDMLVLEKANQALQKELAQAKKESSASSSSAAATSASSTSNSLSKEEREELMQLRREVAEYEVEFRSLKNQDITIRKLELKITELQTTAVTEFQTQMEQAKMELAETEGRRAAEALEREAAAERKVQTLELQLRAERAGLMATQAHMFQADEGVSQREAAWEAQKRILVDDAERLREQLQIITQERDDLVLRSASGNNNNSSNNKTPSSSGSIGKGGTPSVSMTPPPSGGGEVAVSMTDLMLERKAYEAEVAELSETTTLLREELREKEEAFALDQRQSSLRIQGLERSSKELVARVHQLESQLASAPSLEMVETMKRELRILKRLEYNADGTEMIEPNVDNSDPEIAGLHNEQQEEKNSLESVLVAKLRRAESDLVTERTTRTTIRQDLESVKQSLVQAEKEKSDLEQLVSSLEKDLEKAISSSTTTASPRSASRKLNLIPTEGNPSTLQQVLDPHSPPLSIPEPESTAKATTSASNSSTAQEKADDDHSVATIVMAQRDRLRARCEALEAERDSFKRELQAQVQASESLKSDNTKLYEKVRYLQNYNKPTSSGNYGGGGGNRHLQSRNRGIADRDLDLEALEQRYEASVDPFRQFSRGERQRKLNEMSPMERTVFIVAKTFLATKEMRTALFFYVLAMHLLVFVTTYHWSHTSSGCHTSMADLEHLTHLPPQLYPVAEADAGGGLQQAAQASP